MSCFKTSYFRLSLYFIIFSKIISSPQCLNCLNLIEEKFFRHYKIFGHILHNPKFILAGFYIFRFKEFFSIFTKNNFFGCGFGNLSTAHFQCLPCKNNQSFYQTITNEKTV